MSLHKYIPAVQIHPVLIIFIIISFVTGTFVELTIILSIVLFHELGHFMMATYFNWRISRVMLWVFGGVMDTEEHGNKPLHEEILVIIAGPLQHVVIYIIVFGISSLGLFAPSIIELILYYNTVLLIFNLVPIWPLDGGKLFFAIISIFLPFKKAFNMIIIFSIFTTVLCILIQLLLIPFTLSALFVMLFLLMENRTEWKQRFYVFIRFLLKRYENNQQVNIVQPIIVSSEATMMDVFEQFKRNKTHPVYIEYSSKLRKSIAENECLQSYFYDRNYDKSVGEIANLFT